MKFRRFSASIAGSAGILLLAASVLVSNPLLERAFGRQPGSLAWGPLLFRILLALHGLVLLAASRIAIHADAPPGFVTIGRRPLAAHSGSELLHVAR
jgi:hypothetical protein